MGNNYPEQDVGKMLAGFLSQFSAIISQANNFGVASPGLNMLVSALGLNPSQTPGNTFLNRLDRGYQQPGVTMVDMSSQLAVGGGDANNLQGIIRGMLGSSAHERPMFMGQYRRALNAGGVFADFYNTPGIIDPTTQKQIDALGISRDVQGRSTARRDSITDFFKGASQTYKNIYENDAVDVYGGASLGTVGKVAAEMVRTNRSAFDMEGLNPAQITERKNKLQTNLQSFVRLAEDLKGVLGGDALHALDKMNDVFGVNVQATFRGQSDIISRNASDMLHTSRLTGTPVSNIFRTAEVAGQAMSRMPGGRGSRMGSMLVGVMATQAGQADDLNFIDEPQFRSMQTMRYAGAMGSQTSRQLSGAYAMWRAGAGKEYKDEAEARAEFNKQIRDRAESTGGKIYDTAVMRNVSGATSDVDLMNASRTQMANKYRTTDRMSTQAAIEGQIGDLEVSRTYMLRGMFEKSGISGVDATAFEGATEEERIAMLTKPLADGGPGLSAQEAMTMVGRTRDALSDISASRGYLTEENYQQARVANKNAIETQARVARRTHITRKLEDVVGTKGLRGVLMGYDKIKNASSEDQLMFRELLKPVLGITDNEDMVAAIGLGFVDDAARITDTDKGKVADTVMKAIETSESGILEAADQTALKEAMTTLAKPPSALDTPEERHRAVSDAYSKVQSLGTKSGYKKARYKEHIKNYGVLDPAERKKLMRDSSMGKKIAFIEALDDSTGMDAAKKEELFQAVQTEGVNSEAVRNALESNKELSKNYGRETTLMGLSAGSKEGVGALIELVKKIFEDMPKSKKENSTNEPIVQPQFKTPGE